MLYAKKKVLDDENSWNAGPKSVSRNGGSIKDNGWHDSRVVLVMMASFSFSFWWAGRVSSRPRDGRVCVCITDDTWTCASKGCRKLQGL